MIYSGNPRGHIPPLPKDVVTAPQAPGGALRNHGKDTTVRKPHSTSPPRAPLASRREQAACPAPGRPYILVIEDEPDIGELLAAAFDIEGFHTTVAPDARSALLLVEAGQPDAITLDIDLPDRDGHWLLHALKNAGHSQGIPVIVVSAASTRLCPDDHCLLAGIVDKPFDLGELLQVTRKALDKGDTG